MKLPLPHAGGGQAGEGGQVVGGDDDVAATGEDRVLVVRSPRAGVHFWSLGDFDGARDAARARAAGAVAASVAAGWGDARTVV
jgi:hypothetical protein